MQKMLYILIIYSSISIACSLINLYLKKVKKLDGIRYIDCLNPIKWWNIMIGFVFYVLIPLHVLEQYVLRFYEPTCQPCIEKGHCINCGCHTMAKMWSPSEKDSKNMWGPIMWSKRKYQKFREEFPVKITIKYGSF